jgi:hypothetical protein
MTSLGIYVHKYILYDIEGKAQISFIAKIRKLKGTIIDLIEFNLIDLI